jgi:hypothetical protein
MLMDIYLSNGVKKGAAVREIMKKIAVLVLSLLITLGVSSQSLPAEEKPQVRWFPIYARLSPDGSWAVVNLCSYYNPLYCRLVHWEIGGTPQVLEDGSLTTGRWTVVAGQEPDKSYIWPSVSWDGKKLAYVVAQCLPVASQTASAVSIADRSEIASTGKLNCDFYNGQPATSGSVKDIKDRQLLPIYGATRPAWRPDDQAILYWRSSTNVTLNSGKALGFRGVYEYDFKTMTETPKSAVSDTKLRWGAEATGPFYAPDGKTFAICGYGFNFPESLGLQARIQCIQVEHQNPAVFKGINELAKNSTLQWLMGDWNGTHWVTGGEQVRLIEKQSFEITAQLLSRRLVNGQFSNLEPVDVHVANGGDAVVVSRTLWQFSQPIRRSSYFSTQIKDAPAAPLLSLYVAKTKDIRPVFWPNVEQLN